MVSKVNDLPIQKTQLNIMVLVVASTRLCINIHDNLDLSIKITNFVEIF